MIVFVSLHSSVCFYIYVIYGWYMSCGTTCVEFTINKDNSFETIKGSKLLFLNFKVHDFFT